MNLRSSLLILVFGLQLVAVLATATSALAEDDATIEIARQRFREGVQFYDAREYEKARLAFLQAYALKPHPSVLLNLAQSELRADRPADASNHFSQYLRENPDSSDAERQEAELGFAAARTRVGEVRLLVDREGAEITLDGKPIGRSPLAGPFFVEPGSHTLEARDGHRSATQTIRVAAGKSTTARLRLVPVRSASGATPASSESRDSEGAPQTDSASFSTDDAGGGRMPFFEWFAETPVAWVGAGVAGLGLGTGTAFAIMAKSEYDRANNLERQITDRFAQDNVALGSDAIQNEGPCALSPSSKERLTRVSSSRPAEYATYCANYSDSVNAADTNKVIATVGFVVGGFALAGTLFYYFIDPSAEVSSGANGNARPWYAGIQPVATPTEQGVSIQGSF